MKEIREIELREQGKLEYEEMLEKDLEISTIDANIANEIVDEPNGISDETSGKPDKENNVCRICSQENFSSAKFCKNCGAKL
jgi:hypothetical protein